MTLTARFVRRSVAAVSMLVLGGLSAPQAVAQAQAPAPGRDFRLALERDTSSLDSMRNWDALTLAITANIYDPLIDFEPDRGFFSRLAERWEQVEPNRWRFWLRRGVTFHDGTPFTADDVVFSTERMRNPKSRGRNVLRNLREVVKVDDFTVDFIASGPDPVLINQFNTMMIMSRAWAERNGAAEPADFARQETNHAVNNANGTGPFIVETWEPGVRLVLRRNPNWWGWGEYRSNVGRAILTPIASPATRVAGLLSGELDMVSPVPVQDAQRLRTSPGTQIVAGHEARAVFLGLDLKRDELLHSSVRGANPLRDIRVRQAMLHAINVDALNRVVFRGFAKPAAMIVPEGVSGFDPSRQRLPFDQARARALLREAGYPDGFRITLDCPAGREIGDRDACEAMGTMLSQVGIRVELLAQPPARWFPKVVGQDTSLFYMSWGNNGWAGGNTLFDLLSCTESRRGGFNMGGYCNAEFDAIVARARAETRPQEHQRLLREAFDVVARELPLLPIYYPPILWGARDFVTVKLRPDGRVFLPHVSLR